MSNNETLDLHVSGGDDVLFLTPEDENQDSSILSNML